MTVHLLVKEPVIVHLFAKALQCDFALIDQGTVV